jgi:hypothetical protein
MNWLWGSIYVLLIRTDLICFMQECIKENVDTVEVQDSGNLISHILL